MLGRAAHARRSETRRPRRPSSFYQPDAAVGRQVARRGRSDESSPRRRLVSGAGEVGTLSSRFSLKIRRDLYVLFLACAASKGSRLLRHEGVRQLGIVGRALGPVRQGPVVGVLQSAIIIINANSCSSNAVSVLYKREPVARASPLKSRVSIFKRNHHVVSNNRGPLEFMSRCLGDAVHLPGFLAREDFCDN